MKTPQLAYSNKTWAQLLQMTKIITVKTTKMIRDKWMKQAILKI